MGGVDSLSDTSRSQSVLPQKQKNRTHSAGARNPAGGLCAAFLVSRFLVPRKSVFSFAFYSLILSIVCQGSPPGLWYVICVVLALE